MFRRYLKKDALEHATYLALEKMELNQKAYQIIHELQLPEELVVRGNTKMACLILLCAYKLGSGNKLQDRHRALFEPGQADDLWGRYFNIFRDSNTRNRILFFRDPLI